MAIKGKLSSNDTKATFAGCRVDVAFTESVAVGDGAATEKIPAVQSAVADDAGEFFLDVPANAEKPFVIRVSSPDGQEIARATSDGINETTLKIKTEQVAVPTPPAASSPRVVNPPRLGGRVIEKTGKAVPAGLEVAITGEDSSGGVVSLLVTRTDAQGYFFGEWPPFKLKTAKGMVAGQETLITLENEFLPHRIVLALDLAQVVPTPPSPRVPGRPCGCAGKVKNGGGDGAVTPPRAPDQVDLAASPETFSQDVGGRCVDFTVPNRSLEEFDYFHVVRTTEPQIRGLTLDGRKKAPEAVARVAGNLLSGNSRRPADESRTASRSVSIGSLFNRFRSSTPTTVIAPRGAIRVDVLDKVLRANDELSVASVEDAADLSTLKNLRDDLLRLRKNAPTRAPLTANNPIDWDETPTFYEATSIAHGHLLHFKQTWHADGYSLGDLLYSLALPPGHKKEIAIIDWERREVNARTEATSESEELRNSLSHDRDISEIVDSTLTEELRGGSSAKTGGFGGGLGLAGAYKGVTGVLGISGGMSKSSSSSWQDSSRNLTSSALQQLHDRTMQAASSVRSQRSTVVQSTRQGETVDVQTEVVTNHNHCHAMTVEYFEVLRHFLISEDLVDVQECLFVPLPMDPFDPSKAARWQDLLRRALLERRFLADFEALRRLRSGTEYPGSTYAHEAITELDGELRIRMTIARPRDPFDGEAWATYSTVAWAFWAPLIPSITPLSIFRTFLQGQPAADARFQERVAPQLAEAFVQQLVVELIDSRGHAHPVKLDPTLVSKYKAGVSLYVRIAPLNGVPAIRRDDIKSIRIRTTRELPPDSKVIVESGTFRYRTSFMDHALFPQSRILNDLDIADPVDVPTPLDHVELRNPRLEDITAVKRLVAHLNDHLEYYHKAIWRQMDPDRRFMFLDGVVAPNSGGRSVASVTENRLAGIIGNSLVMPVTRGLYLDPSYASPPDQRSLLELYKPAERQPSARISVPTRGVFAEAVLGSCVSCEKKDDTLFWRWEESPIDEPTAITGVSAESRRSDPPNLSPTPFPTPMINLQNAPAAPDPTGMAAALQLLSNPNLFRDAAGLTETQKNALATYKQTMETAQSMGTEAAKMFTSMMNQRAMSKDGDKVIEKIDQGVADQSLTPEQGQSLKQQAIRTMMGATEPEPPRVTEQPEVRELIRNAADRPGSTEVTVASGTDQVSVKPILATNKMEIPANPAADEWAEYAHQKAPTGSAAEFWMHFGRNTPDAAYSMYSTVRSLLIAQNGWAEPAKGLKNFIDANIQLLTFLGQKQFLNAKLKDPLAKADAALAGSSVAITDFQGFAVRLMSKSTTKLSEHSSGQAIDIDPKLNPLIADPSLILIIRAVTKTDLGKAQTYDDLLTASNKFKTDWSATWIDTYTDPDPAVADVKKAIATVNADTGDGGLKEILDGCKTNGFLNLPKVLVTELQKAGFKWGGEFTDRKDFMHFELP